jgi:hypothetical protein
MMAEVNNPVADVEGSARELCVDAAVVSMSVLSDAATRLDGVQRLMVERKAIVTPAVRDLLRERKIELAYRTASKGKPTVEIGKKGTLRLVLAAADISGSQIDALVKLLTRLPLDIERLNVAGLVEIVDELARRIGEPATIGLLLTTETAAALCLANRMKQIRALAIGEAGTLAGLNAAAKAIGANLLILDPTGRSPFALKPWIERFCQGAPRGCPEKWRGRLD